MSKIGSAILLAILFNSVSQASELKTLWQASRALEYRAVSASEVSHAEALFLRMFAGEWHQPATRDAWDKLGFQVETVSADDQRYVVLHESPARRDGRGFFIFATDKTRVDALQAPHAFTDLYTGAIAVKLMTEGRFITAALNTVPRRYDKGGVMHGADMAHLPDTYMIAFSRAFARQHPADRVIQLHGFSAAKRPANSGSDAVIIISAGTKNPSAHAYAMTDCLRDTLGNAAYLYPRDVRELGGTYNEIGKVLRQLGSNGFVHIEMEKKFRQTLRKDRAMRRTFLRCAHSKSR